jgi:hypothetical protein
VRRLCVEREAETLPLGDVVGGDGGVISGCVRVRGEGCDLRHGTDAENAF